MTREAWAGAAGRQEPSGPYGLPARLFERLWTVDDVCAFAHVGERKARALLAQDGAPPRLRMGSSRCDRWNPVLVVAWLHGDDWRALAQAGPVLPDAATGPGVEPAGTRPAAVALAGPEAVRGRPPGRPFVPPPPLPATAARSRR